MTIDWDKPLRIKGHDEQEHDVRVRNTGVRMLQEGGTVNRVLICHIEGWEFKWVTSQTGEDRLGIMPRVYNAKRRPAEGEWWMCREKVGAVLTERPYCLRNGRWRVSSMGLACFPIDSVEPLYPLIKDPDF